MEYGEENELENVNFFYDIMFFKYTGKDRSLSLIYDENKKSTCFLETNKNYLESSTISAFCREENNKKIILWEPLFTLKKEDNTDIEHFQYFLLILNYLEHKNYNFTVRISAGEQTDNNYIYNPIAYQEAWSRLRTFLYLYPANILSKIFIYGKYKKLDKEHNITSEEIRWAHLKAENKEEDQPLNFGKIFPLIAIDHNMYKALVQTSCGQDCTGNEWAEKFYNLYKIYIRRFLQAKYKIGTVMESHVKANGFYNFEKDSLLEGLIFVSILVYLEDYSLTDKSRRKELTRLHEICIDYAQGIAQLIENTLFHVIRNENTEEYDSGCGSFTFRIREKSAATYLKNSGTNNEEKFSKIMELYVVDFNYRNFEGFVNKFINNVNKRSSIIEPAEIKLPHLFGEGLEKNSSMKRYFEDSENIAMHYGLQILNNIIVTMDGSLYVVSGSGEDNRPDEEKNSFFNSKANMYIKPDFFWKNGTAYVIYLPIKYEQELNYGDVISISNFECQEYSGGFYVQLLKDKHWVPDISLTPEGKKIAIDNIKNRLLNEINSIESTEDKIFYIDINAWNLNLNIYLYEVLSKAIFILLHEKNLSSFNHIALINLPSEYDVIKLFRQFALFYNRWGENENMANKSVYFMDCEGELDLLLYGEKLDRIKNNLAYGKIYGGYSSVAMEIIRHLSERGNYE